MNPPLPPRPHALDVATATATATATEATDAVMRGRRTVRAYRPDPVAKQVVTQILEVAGRAPSNSNSQPWRVHVLTGAPKQALGDALVQAHEDDITPAYAHFPDDLPEACRQRQEDFGQRYYGALGIDRADTAARARATRRNFHFFGAPVGMIVTIDARLTKHSWLDCGLFVQSVMIAAAARGLATCPQVVFVRYQAVIAAQLGLPPDQAVACGLALGHAAQQESINQLDMPREPVAAFASLLGFDDGPT